MIGWLAYGLWCCCVGRATDRVVQMVKGKRNAIRVRVFDSENGIMVECSCLQITHCRMSIEGSNESDRAFEERDMLCYNILIKNPRTLDVH